MMRNSRGRGRLDVNSGVFPRMLDGFLEDIAPVGFFLVIFGIEDITLLRIAASKGEAVGNGRS